jgi:hypothetical protein
MRSAISLAETIIESLDAEIVEVLGEIGFC